MRSCIFGLVFVLFATAAAAQSEPVHPTGALVRPYVAPRDPAQQTDCVATGILGPFSASVGDLIEIDYRYLLSSSCTVPAAQVSVTGNGAVVASSLGTLPIDEAVSTSVTTGAFFQAVQLGEDTVTLELDGQTYSYDIQVQSARADSPEGGAAACLIANVAASRVVRPWVSIAGGCFYTPETGTYDAVVGDLIELDLAMPTSPPCLHTPRMRLIGDQAVVASSLGSLGINTGRAGTYQVANFFQAVQPGKSVIVLKLKGHNRRYVINVSAAGAPGQ